MADFKVLASRAFIPVVKAAKKAKEKLPSRAHLLEIAKLPTHTEVVEKICALGQKALALASAVEGHPVAPALGGAFAGVGLVVNMFKIAKISESWLDKGFKSATTLEKIELIGRIFMSIYQATGFMGCLALVIPACSRIGAAVSGIPVLNFVGMIALSIGSAFSIAKNAVEIYQWRDKRSEAEYRLAKYTAWNLILTENNNEESVKAEIERNLAIADANLQNRIAKLTAMLGKNEVKQKKAGLSDEKLQALKAEGDDLAARKTKLEEKLKRINALRNQPESDQQLTFESRKTEIIEQLKTKKVALEMLKPTFPENMTEDEKKQETSRLKEKYTKYIHFGDLLKPPPAPNVDEDGPQPEPSIDNLKKVVSFQLTNAQITHTNCRNKKITNMLMIAFETVLISSLVFAIVTTSVASGGAAIPVVIGLSVAVFSATCGLAKAIVKQNYFKSNTPLKKVELDLEHEAGLRDINLAPIPV